MDGIAWVNSSLRITDITDGSSNTFLILESASYGNQSWLDAEKGSNHFLWVHHASQGYVNGAEPPNVTSYNNRSARGSHNNGVTASWADGRVGFISNTITLATYTNMFTRGSGEVINPY